MPKHLTVMASVVSAGIDPRLPPNELSIRVPDEPLSLLSFELVHSRLTDIQLVQIYVGLVKLRRVFSRRLVAALILHSSTPPNSGEPMFSVTKTRCGSKNGRR